MQRLSWGTGRSFAVIVCKHRYILELAFYLPVGNFYQQSSSTGEPRMLYVLILKYHQVSIYVATLVKSNHEKVKKLDDVLTNFIFSYAGARFILALSLLSCIYTDHVLSWSCSPRDRSHSLGMGQLFTC